MNNTDWLDEILDLYGHAVINYGKTEGSRTRLKAKYGKQILNHLDKVIGEDENDLPENEANYWTYPKIRNRLRAELRKELGL